MIHAKKDPAGAGEISAKSKADTKGNGKVIPLRPKSGKRGTQREKGIRRKKKKPTPIKQIAIDFPPADGNDRKTSEFGNDPCGGAAGCARRIGLGACLSTNCPHEKREEGVAAENKRPQPKAEGVERRVNKFLKEDNRFI
jgi:hypothetical protein